MTSVQHYCYISTGKLSAMYTLWRGRTCNDPRIDALVRDQYICNLAGIDNEEAAELKAKEYAERMGERMGVTIAFRGFYDEPQNHRKGKLSVMATRALEAIERGVFPFGKHKNEAISSAPDSYILYFADMHSNPDPVISALSAACMGVALERDLIAKRDAKRVAQAELDAKSEFVGNVGDRMNFAGVLEGVFLKNDDYSGNSYFINKVRCGDNLITYLGNALGEGGNQIAFKATVKRHSEYKGVKSTVVSRPSKVQAI